MSQHTLVGDLEAILLPNGEISIYKQKRLKERSLVQGDGTDIDIRVREFSPEEKKAIAEGRACPLGLSPLGNFDKKARKPRPRYGLKGITSLGKKRVRNACYLLQQSFGKHRMTFATCTIPPLPAKTIRLIQENWSKVVEGYRREIRRRLLKHGLSGEIVTVSEVQTERYEDTGVPVLHIHSVFVGRRKKRGWAISPRLHDKIWKRAVENGIGRAIGKRFNSACNLQRVKKNAEAYLGKYVSKGVENVRALVASGFTGWMPKQWFNLSRSITKRINRETRRFKDGASLLADMAGAGIKEVWIWHREVLIEVEQSVFISVALYGRLTPWANQYFRDFLQIRKEKNKTVRYS